MRPIGIADAEMAPILGADGRPLAARGWYDTESIAEDGGTLYVGIERVHQIVRFNYGKEGLAARGRPIALPPGLRALPANRGLEAMREGSIPTDWFARQVEQANRSDGDIDTLSSRIAHIRTWTFAANRPDWLADPEHWQGVTRAVEDQLSDALHERLTERFVDRRTSVLMRRLRENTVLETDISKSGEVVVEGHAIGRLDGFMGGPWPRAPGPDCTRAGDNPLFQKEKTGRTNVPAQP